MEIPDHYRERDERLVNEILSNVSDLSDIIHHDKTFFEIFEIEPCYIEFEPMPENTPIKSWNKGLKHTDSHKAAIGDALRGRPKTEKHKAALRKPKSFVSPRTKEHNRKIGLSNIGKSRPTTLCPHCNKSIGAGNFTRWHGNNCREIKN